MTLPSILLSIEILALLSFLVSLLQAAAQWRRSVRLRGAVHAAFTLLGAPLLLLGLVLLYTRFGFLPAAFLTIAFTVLAAWLAWGDRGRWRLRPDYRVGLLSLCCDLIGSILTITAIIAF